MAQDALRRTGAGAPQTSTKSGPAVVGAKRPLAAVKPAVVVAVKPATAAAAAAEPAAKKAKGYGSVPGVEVAGVDPSAARISSAEAPGPGSGGLGLGFDNYGSDSD